MGKSTSILTAVIIATMAAGTGMAGGDLASNGSFENGPAFGGGFITLGTGSTAITDWQVVQGNVEYIGAHWQAADGARSIDLNGNQVGAIRQTLNTVPGTSYEVTFALAANPGGPVKVKTLRVSADTSPATSADYAFDYTGFSVSNMGWRDETFTFVATSSATALTFQSTTFDPCRCQGPALDHVRVALADITVDLDVKPGSDKNPINTRSRGVIPVAVLTTEAFDASTVAVGSLAFGPGGAAEAHGKGHLEDVDGDGDIDLVLHFRTQEAAIPKGATEACLTGATLDGTPLSGCDVIRTTRG